MLAPTPIPLIRCDEQHPASFLNRGWRRGDLTRIIPGVYAEATAWKKLTPWDRQLAQVYAVALTHDGAIACGISASALHGVTIGGAGRGVHLLDPQGTSRRIGKVRTHTSSDQRELVQSEGLLLTNLADTIVDIARSMSPAEGLSYANALLRLDRSITPEQVIAVNETRASSRNRRHARWALSRANGIPESVLESLSLAVIEMSGFESPDLQREFRFEGEIDRGDFYWHSAGVLGEADGTVKYRGDFGDPTDAILAEKQRDARLRRHLNDLIHWGWEEARTPALLTPLLVRAGVPRPNRPDTALLATISQFGR